MNKNQEIDIGGVPEQNVQALEGLKNTEVRNHNNETQQSALNGAEEINHSVGKTASVSSRTESIQRYKDAVKEALELEFVEFIYSQPRASWKSWTDVGERRKELNLTAEQATSALEEVYEEFAKNVNPRDWDIFQNGTPEERRKLQDSTYWEM